MKATKRLVGFLVTLLFVALNFTICAEAEELAAAEPVAEQPDSVVRIVAEAKGLTLAEPDKLPLHGTF